MLNITVGIISIIFSIYALYDFIEYKRTKSTDGLLLSLPQLIKNQIHKIIGSCYRVHTKADSPDFKRSLIGLVGSALVTGFLVSILEAVCVAKIYLPTIIFVLKIANFKSKALIYLLLYNLLFVVPLLVIFSFALAGTTSERFQKVLKGHLGLIKILMGVMFLALGIFLIWRA
jgi:cytochrome c biogenesis protein CcdA